jgi:chromosome segregation ATPase
MYEIRDTRPWFWILILVVLGVAVAGLVVAISAKNSSVDQQQLVDEASKQVKAELADLSGALKAADKLQEESSREAAKARARINRTLEKAEATARGTLRKLGKRVASLEAQVEKVQGTDTKLKKNVAALNQGQVNLAAEMQELRQRLNRFINNGGT